MKGFFYLRLFFSGSTLAVFSGSLGTLLIFDILWCAQTTFRAMSFPELWTIMLTVALLLSLPYVLSRSILLQTILLLAADVLLIANLMYCRTYFTSIPIESYLIAGNLKDFMPSVTDSFRITDLLLPLNTAGTMIWAYKTAQKNRYKASLLPQWTLCTAVTLSISVVLIILKGGFTSLYSNLKEACYYSTCTTPIFTIAGDYFYQLTTTTEFITENDSIRVETWLSDHNQLFPLTALPDTVVSQRDNLVIILCESFESWLLEAKADGKEITPYLNSLIGDSTTLYAPNMVTQVASGRSIDCQLLLTAGMFPMMNGVFSMSYPSNTYPTLNRALTEANGARSLILTPDAPTTWNQALVVKSFGIDSLMARDSWKLDEMAGNPPKLSDGSFLRQVAERLSDNDIWPVNTNRFIQILTYSGHNPFRLPESLQTIEFSNRYPEKLRDYMITAHYTDEALKTLIETIKKRPDYDRTIIVITGDHEGLAGSRKEIRMTSPADSLVSQGQFTPFIVLNSPVSGRIDEIVGQADMYPTLLQLMGLTDYKWTGMGVSMLSDKHPSYAIVTMTGEVVGDTTLVDSVSRQHISDSRFVSDRMIRFYRKP